MTTIVESIGVQSSMKEILLLCDSGGSNGYRPRFWKNGLYHKIARVRGISVTVCHYTPGASKWNLNVAGQPAMVFDARRSGM